AWAVPALALSHSVAFAFGAVALLVLLSRRVGRVGTPELARSLWRSISVSLLALAAMGAIAYALPESTKVEALVSFAAIVVTGGAIYIGLMAKLRAPELRRFASLVGREAGSAGSQNKRASR
ncbi:MAG: hypothetical protein ACRDJB_11625, partial [Actinomycetota bacterium]